MAPVPWLQQFACADRIEYSGGRRIGELIAVQASIPVACDSRRAISDLSSGVKKTGNESRFFLPLTGR